MKKQLFLAILIIVILIGGGAFAYYRMSHQTFQAGDEQQGPSKEEAAKIIAMVRNHIVLPDDEEPLIAKVADIDLLLQKEPFYKGAKNGDILLLYPNAGKAILYSQDDDVIINVGPIVVDQPADGGAQPDAPVASTSEVVGE